MALGKSSGVCKGRRRGLDGGMGIVRQGTVGEQHGKSRYRVWVTLYIIRSHAENALEEPVLNSVEGFPREAKLFNNLSYF